METFTIGEDKVPRLFVGLWQLSSPAWGSAPRSKIMAEFQKYVDAGFTAFDMADHYGDAELLFGRFKSSYTGSKTIFCSTKYCVFESTPQTEQALREAISRRLSNIKSDKIDLLQYHWHDYGDPQYIPALRIMQADPRVSNLGLCNFDTKRMKEAIDAGINFATNQVQRPTSFSVAASCPRNGSVNPLLKLSAKGMTPSLRKYLEMITIWGGWPLFQTLLNTLSAIAAKHSVSITTVAVRWVLDFPYVGAVLVGARMGVSEHIEANLAVYGWSLDDEDQGKIEEILKMSRRDDVFTDMGDCGSEYR
ncbi:conserved hypothetical protein [Uncinocarpus reesii 1704]|uniref:NADP-dependent oxidoreductase domain-containing protein n=1 Tax=Uncinocarpus reesii (strain UAMH 1704) TaxID=336963 RepID=C4JXA8_UNCRE|nr:uncharacterized protein UREG_06281 [Uncinocarpus reesii 1704]EEP81416.1 conserved hypothetical protein [Uncinocarpus reesii 1704]